LVSSEKWFVYEWSDSVGEPNIIAWCKTRKEAEREFESAVVLARRTVYHGREERVTGTEYAICHIRGGVGGFTVTMPLIGFTKLKEKLLDGSKTQTIRKPRKHPIKVGDKLFIYWKLRTKSCEKLGEGLVTKIVKKRFDRLTEEDAVKDGFEAKRISGISISALGYLKTELGIMHGFDNICESTEFDIITWNWTCMHAFKEQAQKELPLKGSLKWT